jgi:branched-chain amino acid transport system substrate-binding protein
MKSKPFLISVFFVLIISVSFFQTASAQLKPGDPIIIGVPSALGSSNGRDSWMAIQMAVDEINAKGGVQVGGTKHLLKAYSIDTREHEPGIPVHDALIAVEKLILEKKPHVILLGAFRSEILVASMDLVSKYKIPYLCSIAMTPVMQTKILEDYDKYKYMFRICLNAQHFVRYLTQVMGFMGKEFGFNKSHIVVQDVLWATGSGKGMEKWLKENNWQVTGFDSYPVGATDFSPSLIKVRAQKAQVITAVFDMTQSIILLKQSHAMKVPALICGQIEPAGPAYSWDASEGAVEGMVNFMFDIGAISVKAIPKSVAFIENFGKKWGKDARGRITNHGPGPSYDSVYVFADAIERAKTVDPDAVVSALEKTDMSGVVGRIRFGKDHQVAYGLDPKETALSCAFQWKKPGTRVVVYPETVAEGKIELPPYMMK